MQKVICLLQFLGTGILSAVESVSYVLKKPRSNGAFSIFAFQFLLERSRSRSIEIHPCLSALLIRTELPVALASCAG